MFRCCLLLILTLLWHPSQNGNAAHEGRPFTVTCISEKCSHVTCPGISSNGQKCPHESGNGTRIFSSSSKNDSVFLVYHEQNFNRIFERVFPLHIYYGHWLDLLWHIDNVTPGRLISLSFLPWSRKGLRNVTKELTALGATMLTDLPSRLYYTITFIKGGKVLMESAASSSNKSTFHTQVFFSPSSEKVQMCLQPENHAMCRYCENYGILDDLCTLSKPWSQHPWNSINKHPIKEMNKVPIILAVGKRHQYLYSTLKHIAMADGFVKDNVYAVSGDTSNATNDLLALFDIKQVRINVQGDGNDVLFQYYKLLFAFVVERLNSSEYAIFLEEDVQVSPDFFNYFRQTLPLLKNDSSLYCVNAYSAMGYNPFARNPSKLLRADAQVQYGYGLTLNFIKEIVSVWPSSDKSDIWIYDYWIYKRVRKDRECIFPEVSRTIHFGMGVNSHPITHEIYNMNMPIVSKTTELENVEQMLLPKYKKILHKVLSMATVLTGNPCNSNFLSNLTDGTYVFYYLYKNDHKYKIMTRHYHTLARCLKLWAYNRQGTFEGVTYVHVLENVHLYLVGAPASPFSLWNNTVALFDFDEMEDKDLEILKHYLEHEFEETPLSDADDSKWVETLFGKFL